MKRQLRTGDIHPAHVLRDEYGMNAANRPTIEIDPEEVPEHLRALIPYAERWAISCDVTRGDYFSQQPEEDVADLWNAVLSHVDAIGAWIREQPEHVSRWPRAAYHFLVLLKAHAEAYQHSDEELEALRARQARHERARARERALAAAAEAFRLRDYARTVSLLAPFADELDRVAAAKLAYARKRTRA